MQEINCFVSLSRKIVIDIVGIDGRGGYGKKSFDEIRVRYPDATLMDLNDAAEAIEQLHCSTRPMVITQDAFLSALYEVPPTQWCRLKDDESFKSSEFFSGRVTAIYARIGSRYFAFHGLFDMPHDKIIAFCQNA